jgi:hypothetical protein
MKRTHLVCTVAGCGRPHKAKGLCDAHRQRAMRGASIETAVASRHGHTAGGVVTRTYDTWRAMLARCEYPGNASYHAYGARGVAVCERWHDFRNFLADMGDRPRGSTLDRIKNARGYEPGNCRWATYAEQAANRDTARAERNGRSRLTSDQVAAIRAEHSADGTSSYALAKRYGVDQGTVAALLQGRTWKLAALRAEVDAALEDA